MRIWGQLVQSIKERGIITPVTLRPKEDGRYEIVSGHRRKKACELAGLDTVKAEVREMTRDEAIMDMKLKKEICHVDSYKDLDGRKNP